MLTFKIRNKFFITNIQDKQFDVLLGYDFINNNRIILNTQSQSLLIDNLSVPFVNNCLNENADLPENNMDLNVDANDNSVILFCKKQC